jgi:hypothetical protein
LCNFFAILAVVAVEVRFDFFQLSKMMKRPIPRAPGSGATV